MVEMRWVCGALVAAGCSFSGPPAGVSNTGGESDGGLDGLPRTCDWTYAPAHFDPCDLEFAPAPVFTSGAAYRIDTDSAMLLGPNNESTPLELEEKGQGDGVVVAIWAVTSLDFTGSSLRAEGTRSLLIAADGDLVVRGNIDISGNTGAQAAGADHVTACVGSTGGTGQGTAGGGGAGAEEVGAAGQSATTGAGGEAGAAVGLLTIRGGCRGGTGGAGGGAGGPGGGGLHLAARSLVRVDGDIDAGGAGGAPGLESGEGSGSGGGGGGSGGKISLEAPRVELSSVTRLIAGGGGGGGGASIDGIDGMPGKDAPIDGSPAPGGAGGGAAGAGGNGGAGDAAATTAVGVSVGGGGGGGGAVGRIIVRAETLENVAAVISPALREAPFE